LIRSEYFSSAVQISQVSFVVYIPILVFCYSSATISCKKHNKLEWCTSTQLAFPFVDGHIQMPAALIHWTTRYFASPEEIAQGQTDQILVRGYTKLLQGFR